MTRTWNGVKFAHISSQKIIYIHIFFSPGYEKIKGLAIIYDFTACCMIKAKQMGNLSEFDFMCKSYMTSSCILTESNFKTITISSFIIA